MSMNYQTRFLLNLNNCHLSNKSTTNDLLFAFVIRFVIIIALEIVCLTETVAIEIPTRPQPPHLVNDFANLFTKEQSEKLEQYLIMIDDSTSNQICVVTVDNLNGQDKAEYATLIGRSWGIGNKEHNNGIVILVKPKNETGRGEVFIATGYGLEGAIPDAICSEIIQNSMIPFFKVNDYYTGIYKACDQLFKYARKEYHSPRKKNGKEDKFSWFSLIFTIIIIFLIIRRNSRLFYYNATYTAGSYLNSRKKYNNPNGEFSSSNFNNNFGGFGGGSFGGGGAGGSW